MLRSTTPQERRTVSGPLSPQEGSNQGGTESINGVNGSLRRRGSFSFLRRSKSRERSISGSTPSRRLSKKDRRRQEMMQEQIPSPPLRIPIIPHPPDLQVFGSEDKRPDSVAIMSNRAGGSFKYRLAQKSSQETLGSDMYRGMPVPPVPPIPPIPATATTPRSYVDEFPRTESLVHRGRHSYASSAISTINSPRKIRRRKDPTPFNVLVVGAKTSGKTSFLNFLQTTLALPLSKRRRQSRDEDYYIVSSASARAFSNFTAQYVETEIEGERIGVTLWDSEGLDANEVDLQLQNMTAFIESKFEDTFDEESKVARAPGFRDTHIHCVFLVLDPNRLDANIATGQRANQINGVKARANSFVRGRPERSINGLDENLDLNVLRALKGKTTVVPVIAKADTITSAHMAHLKRAVWDSLKSNGLETLEAITRSDDDDEGSDTSSESPKNNHLDERDEDVIKTEGDKFSTTSVLSSSSGSSSVFSASDFDLAKPGKPSKFSLVHTPSSPIVPTLPSAEAPALPLSIISPDPYEPDIIGRQFAWGLADPMNAKHCDFVKLKQTVFTEWRGELRDASRELWYESWRTRLLNKKVRRDGGLVGDARTQ
ncbi:MAG: hypothetical protein ALECFALPRED_003011 [Alectoria fallacina]|uniref:Septin-type G domain-containing protein n=1 Tax=Alectoria fallacina TaxID=1903189 RepID=A0A8H3EFU6_9LECA|nr:MAG: hypothetical protein ALECFALPRED_003011 [Alectoria fallacina]